MTDEPTEPLCSHCGDPFLSGVKHCNCPTKDGYRKTEAGAFEIVRAKTILPMPLVETAALHLAAAAMDVAPEHVVVIDETWKRKAIQLLRALGL